MERFSDVHVISNHKRYIQCVQDVMLIPIILGSLIYTMLILSVCLETLSVNKDFQEFSVCFYCNHLPLLLRIDRFLVDIPQFSI